MSIRQAPGAPGASAGRHRGPHEVVAGLTDDSTASAVATAAVELARRLSVGVRFVHVSQPTRDAALRARAESVTFDAAVGAVQVHDRVPTTFESTTGQPAEVLVARSESAIALVLGERSPRPDGLLGPTAAYCARHARCPVHVVGPTAAGQDVRPLADPGPRRNLEGQANDHLHRMRK